MSTLLCLIAGALYSGAYVAPKPYCFYALAGSTILVAIVRSL